MMLAHIQFSASNIMWLLPDWLLSFPVTTFTASIFTDEHTSFSANEPNDPSEPKLIQEHDEVAMLIGLVLWLLLECKWYRLSLLDLDNLCHRRALDDTSAHKLQRLPHLVLILRGDLAGQDPQDPLEALGVGV
jgi:hypothetical protein